MTRINGLAAGCLSLLLTAGVVTAEVADATSVVTAEVESANAGSPIPRGRGSGR